ncbi:uncharacterized protein MEPE_06198 [Melanopsichium pennsylvanicum]|uniref:Uncharacterized protein n=1 Tax=Melanopsichium pennsylvanicum TaxID=63383 RepID=A0AAJ4XU47_9BASI|nr:uncharacterized protein MEPE_06198 [Melanopsichium pennsylvanicum]
MAKYAKPSVTVSELCVLCILLTSLAIPRLGTIHPSIESKARIGQVWVFYCMMVVPRSTAMLVTKLGLGSLRRRSLTTTTQRFGLRSKTSTHTHISSSWSTSTSASQPVLKNDAPPTPAPPSRPSGQARQGPNYAATTTTTTTFDNTRGHGRETKRNGGKEGSVYASYKSLPYNTKLVFWACGAMFATLGLLAADKLEELFPARNNKQKSLSSLTTSSSLEEGTQPKLIDQSPESNPPPQQPEEKSKSNLFSISLVDRKT